MRKFSLVFVATMLLSISNIFANDVDNEHPSKSLAKQVSELLSVNSLTSKHVDMTIHVFFSLNSEQEIVILKVDADDEVLKSFIENKLDYQKVYVQDYKEGRTYTLPVRIKA